MESKSRQLRILIIDGKGGGLGRQLVCAVKAALPEAIVTAVGTNSAAAGAMRKAGADQTAAGENAVIVACRRTDIIAGAIGIVIADSMLGEITPAMAAAVGQSDAIRVLLPMDRCGTRIAGTVQVSTGALLEDAVKKIQEAARELED